MSMQILLREGFYILKHNLPLGNWTVGFFLLPLHAHADMSRRFQYGQVSHSDYEKHEAVVHKYSSDFTRRNN